MEIDAEDIFEYLHLLTDDDLPLEEKKAKIIEGLAIQMTPLKITRIIKHDSNPPLFRLETNLGIINLGKIDNLISWTRFKKHLADNTGITITKLAHWDNIAQGMLICQEIEPHNSLQCPQYDQFDEWIMQYLQENKAIPYEDTSSTVSGKPFIRDDIIFIYSKDYREWLKANHDHDISSKSMADMLFDAGCRSRVMSSLNDKGVSSRTFWLIPQRIINVSNYKAAAILQEPATPSPADIDVKRFIIHVKPRSSVDEWLQVYLDYHQFNGEITQDNTNLIQPEYTHPFAYNGKVYLFISDMKFWAFDKRKANLSTYQASIMLRQAGCYQMSLEVKTAITKRVLRGVWQLPVAIVTAEELPKNVNIGSEDN